MKWNWRIRAENWGTPIKSKKKIWTFLHSVVRVTQRNETYRNYCKMIYKYDNKFNISQLWQVKCILLTDKIYTEHSKIQETGKTRSHCLRHKFGLITEQTYSLYGWSRTIWSTIIAIKKLFMYTVAPWTMQLCKMAFRYSLDSVPTLV
jgi:hypothetical protein